MNLSGFKAYDIRGQVPSILNIDFAQKLGFAFAKEFNAQKVVIGHDARLSGPALYQALTKGLCAAGVDVTGIGLCGTEEIYFASFAKDFDGGIMITGSHNPADENGFKIVRKGAIPVSGDSGLFAIRDRMATIKTLPQSVSGTFHEESFRQDYIHHLLRYIRPNTLKPMKIIANPGNGCAGLVMQELAKQLPLDITIIHGNPDGTFPNGVPNPLLPENRQITAKAVIQNNADLGIAWDGDFDRCFFFDENGTFIEGYYLVGMIAQALLKTNPHAKIIHDPRLIWNTQTVVQQAGGLAIESKTGHAFIKERMRSENALYGGEMSAHHYYRDFAYCDSGMITWLLVVQLLSDTGKTLSECVSSYQESFPCSGEMNSTVKDIQATISKIEKIYANQPNAQISRTDGLSIAFPNWRFNLRASNTEPVLRLNVESKGNPSLMEEKTQELLEIIRK